MASKNAFDLLIDDDGGEDSFVIIEKVFPGETKAPAPTPSQPPAKLPTKPAPPVQSVNESRNNSFSQRGGATGRGGAARGRVGYQGGDRRGDQTRKSENRDANRYEGKDGVVVPGVVGEGNQERGRGPRQPYHRGIQGGYANAEGGDESGRPPRRTYDRHSGTGRGYEMKREGGGRRNWGTLDDDKEASEMANAEKIVMLEEDKEKEREDGSAAENTKDKEGGVDEEERQPETKEMTLEEYQKVMEEKRKALLALKTQQRKVEIDKELLSMQQLSVKKDNDEVFIKLGSDKELRKKESNKEDEKSKKSLSINEFLKPAKGERYPGGRGRGRGRGEDGRVTGGYGGGALAAALAIQDQAQFPSLGGK